MGLGGEVDDQIVAVVEDFAHAFVLGDIAQKEDDPAIVEQVTEIVGVSGIREGVGDGDA